MMKLLLVRHGDTGPDYRGRYIGSSDVPLWDENSYQVENLSSLVQSYGPQLTCVSSLLRARQTAELLLINSSLELSYDNQLREVDFGRWEGRSFNEIVNMDAELVKQWASGAQNFCFPDGEAIKEFRQRVKERADYYTSRNAETVLLVTHGGVIRAMVCYLLGISFEKYLSFEIHPASLTVLESFEQGSAILAGLNLTGQRVDG